MTINFSGDSKTVDLSNCDFELCRIKPFTREDMEKYPFSIDLYPLNKEQMDWLNARGGVEEVLCGQ